MAAVTAAAKVRVVTVAMVVAAQAAVQTVAASSNRHAHRAIAHPKAKAAGALRVAVVAMPSTNHPQVSHTKAALRVPPQPNPIRCEPTSI